MDFKEDRMLRLEDKVEKMDIHMTEIRSYEQNIQDLLDMKQRPNLYDHRKRRSHSGQRHIYMLNKIKTETFLNPEKEMSVLAQWLADWSSKQIDQKGTCPHPRVVKGVHIKNNCQFRLPNPVKLTVIIKGEKIFSIGKTW